MWSCVSNSTSHQAYRERWLYTGGKSGVAKHMSCATEFFSQTGVTKYLRDMKTASDKKLIAEQHRFSLQ